MHRLLSRTSITIDEAVAILLGQSAGPIDFEPIDQTEDAEADVPLFSLREFMDDQFDLLESDYAEAKYENQPAHIIAEKHEALQQHEAMFEQADAYRCAIADELNKGELSMLKVDSALSNPVYTFITLHSFNKWIEQYGKSVLAALPTVSGWTAQSSLRLTATDLLSEPDTRFNRQKKAVLDEIKRQGYDPKALPKNSPGLRGVKADIRAVLDGSSLFDKQSSFDKVWDKLRNKGFIKDAPSP